MPLVNGQSYQHGMINLQASTVGYPFTFGTFRAVKYKMSAKKKSVTDSQGQIIGYTIDKQESDGSISCLLDEWYPFKAWLKIQAAMQSQGIMIPGGLGIGQVIFDMTVQYGQTQAKLKREKLTVMIQEESKDSTDNQEALVQDIPLFVLSITDNEGDSFVKYSF